MNLLLVKTDYKTVEEILPRKRKEAVLLLVDIRFQEEFSEAC